MPLVVEDGTGLETANSYVSVADADAYHTLRQNTTWTDLAIAADKEAALVKATDFLDERYGGSFKGRRKTDVQALGWPRSEVYDATGDAITGVPELVKRATYEAALRAVSGELNPDLDRGGLVKRTKVGDLEVEYADHAPGSTEYRRIDEILRPYLHGGKLSARVVRV